MAGRWRNRNRGIEAEPTGLTGAGVVAGLGGCVGIAVVIVVVVVGGAFLVLRALGGLDVSFDKGDGTESERVAVVVTPRTDLQPDQVVQVRSSAFDGNTIVGVAQCLLEADTDSVGVAACDETGGRRFAVRADGTLDAPFPVRRVITVAGEAHDCATVPGGCLVVAADVDDGPTTRCTAATPCRLVIAAAADTQRSAVFEYAITG